MQNSTTEKQLTVRQTEVRGLLGEIVEHHKQCEAARDSAMNAQQLALWHGWQAGILLNQIKERIGHGDWHLWLENNVPFDKRTAQLYMKIDNEHPELRANAQRVAQTQPDFKLLRKLKHDTVRKYAIGFVPDKDQPNQHRDIKFSRLASFLNIVNEYNRLKYRHTHGLQSVDFKEAREETGDLHLFLDWLHGRPGAANPWASPS